MTKQNRGKNFPFQAKQNTSKAETHWNNIKGEIDEEEKEKKSM